jgi:hypothetical protein
VTLGKELLVTDSAFGNQMVLARFKLAGIFSPCHYNYYTHDRTRDQGGGNNCSAVFLRRD